METIQITGAILTLLGSVFILLAAIGLIRMPDLYTRIQAGTKASTLGTILVLAGLGMIQPGWALKLFLLVVFVAITNPISSHVLARAAARSGDRFVTGTKGVQEVTDETTEKPSKTTQS